MTAAAILRAVTVSAAVAIFYIGTSRPDHRRQEADGGQQHLCCSRSTASSLASTPSG